MKILAMLLLSPILLPLMLVIFVIIGLGGILLQVLALPFRILGGIANLILGGGSR